MSTDGICSCCGGAHTSEDTYQTATHASFARDVMRRLGREIEDLDRRIKGEGERAWLYIALSFADSLSARSEAERAVIVHGIVQQALQSAARDSLTRWQMSVAPTHDAKSGDPLL